MSRATVLSRPDLMGRRLREAGKRALHKGFIVGQRLGVDILPRHYYSQIPNIAELRRDQAWRRPYDMHAIRGSDLKGQISRAVRRARPSCRHASPISMSMRPRAQRTARWDTVAPKRFPVLLDRRPSAGPCGPGGLRRFHARHPPSRRRG